MALTRFLFATSMLLLTFLVIASASDYGSAPKPKVDDHDTPKPPKVDDHETPKPQEVYAKQLPHVIGIQGLVLCKSGLKSFPIKGAVARITCLAEDEYGYETAPFSILSGATDAKGYFLATLSPSELQDKWKLTECKAFLDYSPFQYCQVPTDVNQGITGHLLASYRILDTKNIKLYSVGPFFYTSETEPKSTPNNGY
ncbi:proline-rich protein 3 [Prunus yedoensis var. nudiflora]|uniref:Proline-rich protein 3 n=1 Tax=Prunus yedoensis var. nudiflora TaxID=2094558 RepID=A0A314ZB88_PRUYE|nr:proline-rich protein 3 [Prunus yedoensis var. nudiflora]